VVYRSSLCDLLEGTKPFTERRQENARDLDDRQIVAELAEDYAVVLRTPREGDGTGYLAW